VQRALDFPENDAAAVVEAAAIIDASNFLYFAGLFLFVFPAVSLSSCHPFRKSAISVMDDQLPVVNLPNSVPFFD